MIGRLQSGTGSPSGIWRPSTLSGSLWVWAWVAESAVLATRESGRGLAALRLAGPVGPGTLFVMAVALVFWARRVSLGCPLTRSDPAGVCWATGVLPIPVPACLAFVWMDVLAGVLVVGALEDVDREGEDGAGVEVLLGGVEIFTRGVLVVLTSVETPPAWTFTVSEPLAGSEPALWLPELGVLVTDACAGATEIETEGNTPASGGVESETEMGL